MLRVFLRLCQFIAMCIILLDLGFLIAKIFIPDHVWLPDITLVECMVISFIISVFALIPFIANELEKKYGI